jgi:hypothetical protein
VAEKQDRLKLGKGSAFVKTRLKRLPQEDDTWEADFFPIPCSGGKQEIVWLGMVLSHAHDFVLAQRTVEEPPSVNDLARLLADALQRPMSGPVHRPRHLYLRAKPEWAELRPHLKQVGIEVLSHEALPKWDRTFGDLLALAEHARAGQGAPSTSGRSPVEEPAPRRRRTPRARP